MLSVVANVKEDGALYIHVNITLHIVNKRGYLPSFFYKRSGTPAPAHFLLGDQHPIPATPAGQSAICR